MAANDNHEPYFTTAWTPPVDCNGCVIRARLICSCGTNDKWWLTFSLMTSPCCDHQGSKLFGPFAQVRLALPHDCRVIALCRLWQGHRCMMWASNCRKCVWDAVSKGLSVLLTSAICGPPYSSSPSFQCVSDMQNDWPDEMCLEVSWLVFTAVPCWKCNCWLQSLGKSQDRQFSLAIEV